MKDLDDLVDPSLSYLISIATAARLKQMFHYAEALAEDGLSFRELRQLGPERNLWRELYNRRKCRCHGPERQAANSCDRARRYEGLSTGKGRNSAGSQLHEFSTMSPAADVKPSCRCERTRTVAPVSPGSPVLPRCADHLQPYHDPFIDSQ